MVRGRTSRALVTHKLSEAVSEAPSAEQLDPYPFHSASKELLTKVLIVRIEASRAMAGVVE